MTTDIHPVTTVRAWLELGHEDRVMTLVEDGSFAEWFRELLGLYDQATFELVQVREAVNEAAERVRHPIDLNYVAIPKDDWERIVGLVNRV